MREKDLQNERLDQIGRQILRSAKLRNEEIEKIVASPALFDSIKARIKAEESRRRPKRFFDKWLSLSFWDLQKTAGAFSLLIVFTACAAVIIFKSGDPPQTAKQTISQEILQQAPPFENSLSTDNEVEETKIQPVKSPAKDQIKLFKPAEAKTAKPVRRPNSLKSPKVNRKGTQEIFYSLTFGGNWEPNGEEMRIVRTELSRAELFALGVNIAVENESAKVKTDLLVGADGFAKAIRFVE